MKSACVTVVHNEADIIEVFVRYHARMFERLFIIDHRSKDGTSGILELLVKEGLPLEVSKEKAPYHAQAEVITAKLKEIRRKYRPAIVVPLDADEFVVGDLRRAAYELTGPDRTLSLTWWNYTPAEGDPEDHNVLKRIRHRSAFINHNQHKPLIPGPVLDHNVFVQEGCHEVYAADDQIVLFRPSNECHLAHFPIRSVSQFRRKALGWLAKVANPHNGGTNPDWSHWKLFYDRLKRGDEISLWELQGLALGYSQDQFPVSLHHLVLDPVPCDGIDIKYHLAEYSPEVALFDAAESLAYELAVALARQASGTTAPDNAGSR